MKPDRFQTLTFELDRKNHWSENSHSIGFCLANRVSMETELRFCFVRVDYLWKTQPWSENRVSHGYLEILLSERKNRLNFSAERTISFREGNNGYWWTSSIVNCTHSLNISWWDPDFRQSIDPSDRHQLYSITGTFSSPLSFLIHISWNMYSCDQQ